MHKDWLKRKLSIEQAEAENMITDARLGPTPVPFGFCHNKWREMIAQMQPDDELWQYSFAAGPLCGAGGFAIVRNGEIVAEMRTWIS